MSLSFFCLSLFFSTFSEFHRLISRLASRLFESICPLLKQASFLEAAGGVSKNWHELKIEPLLANLSCPNRWNTLYLHFIFFSRSLFQYIYSYVKRHNWMITLCLFTVLNQIEKSVLFFFEKAFKSENCFCFFSRIVRAATQCISHRPNYPLLCRRLEKNPLSLSFAFGGKL